MTPTVSDAAGLPTFAEAFRVWLRIGFLSFGGPAGQIALMHRILVEEKRWIGEARFLHALNYCMLLPGPEAQQLATYVGWLLHRTPGGIVAGGLFVLPGLCVIVALSVLYAAFHELAAVQAVFLGVKAAVLAIVVEALLRIGRRALRNRVTVTIAAAAFLAMYAFGVPFPLVILGAGLAGLLAGRRRPDLFMAETVGPDDRKEALPAHARPSWPRTVWTALFWLAAWLAPIAALLAVAGAGNVFAQIGAFFSVMAVVTFGGAYAVLAYVAQQAVETYGWLNAAEMLDGLGLAETTPGPLILVLVFVGYLAAFRGAPWLDPTVAGLLGALLTAWVTFAPSFLWIFVGAPYIERLRGNVRLTAALTAITAAVVGVILNLAVWFGLHVLFRTVERIEAFGLDMAVPDVATVDPLAAVLAAGAAVALLRFHVGMVPVLIACALAGLLARLVV